MNTPTGATAPERTPTEVDRIAEAYVDARLELSPLEATALGLPGRHDDIDDFSPDGLAAMADLRRTTLARLATARPTDDVDHVTIEAMTERLGVAQEIYDAGYEEADLNVIACPLQTARDTLDLMPTDTPDQWSTLAARVARLPEAMTRWHASLQAAAARGQVAARRQVLACVAQAEELAGDDGYFAALPARTAHGELPAAVAADLERAATRARAGYADTARRLRDDLLPHAPEHDGVGRDRYELASRNFLGARVDLEETYAWGYGELLRITAQMAGIADGIVPGGSIADAAAALDADPRYRIDGTQALREWMQGAADNAVTLLAGTHFDIPDPVRTIECCIAPTNSGGIYYTGPSDDFSRPGRMWWSVPRGVTTFGTWRELTTVYHEGVPGHHLQIGQTVYRSGLLNRWRRLMAWTSGHGEGWALYAEKLMAELGYMDDPGNCLGWLDGQSLRAARVVLDIGIHCDLPAPAEVGGGPWDYDKAWAFLKAHANMDDGFLRFELDRYLGWPGQAPSYKIGERLWLGLRDDVERAERDSFNLKAFHRRALDVGGVGLDTLRRAVLEPWSA